MPLMVAPMAMQQMAHEEGELGVSRACKAAGTTMVLSTMGNYSIKQVAQAAGAQHLWFQLYVFKCARARAFAQSLQLVRERSAGTMQWRSEQRASDACHGHGKHVLVPCDATDIRDARSRTPRRRSCSL